LKTVIKTLIKGSDNIKSQVQNSEKQTSTQEQISNKFKAQNFK